MPQMLEGKRAIVTGAARGIGLGIARLFIDRGASVALLDIDKVGLDREIGALGDRAFAVVADVSDPVAMLGAVDEVVARLGGLDVIVNNAATDYFEIFRDHDDAEFDRVIAVNLRGVYLGIKYGGRAIESSGGGAVINIGSIAGLGGVPRHAAYNAAKAGVHSMTQSAALDFPFSVRVNAIAPGAVDTPMLAEAGPSFKEGRGMSVEEFARTSQGRLGRVEDVAGLAAFLASDEASFINGAIVPLDGGASAKAF